ncbi:DHHW family protein [Acutalibacter muris]|uniref:DHHW family protein n=1 Tax=Acutalibacter muris TaxID=1796620 RepID=UPI001C3EEF24|nr:DHHW family protein [Acutalibacter muris]
MEQREYIRRRGGGPVRRPSRHNGPPRFLWLLLALVVLAGVAALVYFLNRNAEDGGDSQSSSPAPSSAVSTPFEDEPASALETPAPTPAAALPDQLYPDSEPSDMGSFMIAGGCGYDYYHFNEETTNSYILAVSDAAESLPSSVNFYSMVIPTSMDVMLQESYLTENSINSSDQRKAIDDYIYPSISAINSSVKTVPLFTPLREHCDEYIYFHSDRTWTQLGAYYAYRSFCSAKGIEPAALDSFTKQEYEGFSGGFYSESTSGALYDDTVEAYFPGGNTSMNFTDSDGVEYEDWSVISDGDGYDSSLLYLIFAAGDQPYKVLENSDITDNSACIVVQDSFGNYFIPFLTQHYQKVYVVDYSRYSHSVQELVNESGATDVILLTNVIATSSSSAVESLQSIF